MIQQSTSYAPFSIWVKSRWYDVIIPNIYWNMLPKLPTAMINIHTKYVCYKAIITWLVCEYGFYPLVVKNVSLTRSLRSLVRDKFSTARE